MIAFLVFCAFGLIVAGLAAFGVYQFSQTEDGKKIFDTIGEVKDLYEKAVNAPGAKEARDKGCGQALIFDLKDAEKLGQKFEKGGTNAREEAQQQLTLICGVAALGNVPACKDLAAAYRSAPGASKDPILIIVNKQGNDKPECAELYDASGARLPDPPGLKN